MTGLAELADAAFANACRSCGAAIEWATTIDGEPMPYDPVPAPDGELELDREPDGTVRAYVCTVVPLVPEGQLDLGLDVGRVELVRYRSHWRTCPTADAHRAA